MENALIREAGRWLGEARLAARLVDTFPDTLRARSRAEVYAIQDEMAAVIGQRDRGEIRRLMMAADPQPLRAVPVKRSRAGTPAAPGATLTG